MGLYHRTGSGRKPIQPPFYAEGSAIEALA